MAKRKVGEVLWIALQCAKDDRQSLIDAYGGDESEEAVKLARSYIKDFEKLQIRLFGTTRSQRDMIIEKMKPVDLLKLMSQNLDITKEETWQNDEVSTTANN